MAEDVIIAFGSNLGDRRHHLARARRLLQRHGQITFTDCSPMYVTEPWGKPDQHEYFNQVCRGRTALSPSALMRFLLDVEREVGRRREQEERWGPRIIDLDLLAYGEQRVKTDVVEVPHPRLHERRFVLVPLADVAPDWRHPVFNKTARELLEECADAGAVRARSDRES